jgi:hypothetical protein
MFLPHHWRREKLCASIFSGGAEMRGTVIIHKSNSLPNEVEFTLSVNMFIGTL